MANLVSQAIKGGWRRSSRSQQGNCVEIRDLGYEIRNSNDPDGPRVRFTRSELVAWVRGAKQGDFDDMIGLAI